MLELQFDASEIETVVEEDAKFDINEPVPGKYLDHDQEMYRSVDAIANSDLLMIERSASDYVWSKNAPVDPTKSSSADFGTALHAAILEPELFLKETVIAQVKSRDTIKFLEFRTENPGKVVLLQKEYDQIKLMIDSAYVHPTINKILSTESDKESSIYVRTRDHDIIMKIRPDLDIKAGGERFIYDLKTTASIDAWRSDVSWKNPLFDLSYGHTAAFYMNVASEHYQQQIDEYHFILIQKTIEFSKYPVAVMTITREELEQYGFFDRIERNLEKYAECKKNDYWLEIENFPVFD